MKHEFPDTVGLRRNPQQRLFGSYSIENFL
jgi:hypothetical protein